VMHKHCFCVLQACVCGDSPSTFCSLMADLMLNVTNE